MGIGRIISRGATRGFFKILVGGSKVVKLVFPLETKKQPILLKFKKSKGGLSPAPLPTPMSMTLTLTSAPALT